MGLSIIPVGEGLGCEVGVTVMVGASLVALVAGFGLPRFWPKAIDWIARGRRALPVLIGLAVAALVFVLAQEALLHLLHDPWKP